MSLRTIHKMVSDDVCSARTELIMNDTKDLKTDMRLLTEKVDRHIVKSVECTSKLETCLKSTKRSIDEIKTDIDILVDNCTKEKPKQSMKVDKDVVMLSLKIIGVLVIVIIIMLKGDPTPIIKMVTGGV